MTCDNNSFKFLYENGESLDYTLSENVEDRIVNHRNEYYRLKMAEYMEVLPTLRRYTGIPTHLDIVKADYLMRQNYAVAIGKTKTGKTMLMGWVNNRYNETDPMAIFSRRRLTERDITFVNGSRNLFPKHMLEITHDTLDEVEEGSVRHFVVIRNKAYSYRNDIELIKHFVTELTELSTSKFALTIASKITMMFKGDIGDESVNQAVARIFNSSPILKINKSWDFEDNFKTIDNSYLSDNIQTLKNIMNETQSELNASLGIKSKATDKESGVTEAEIRANEDVDNVNQNNAIEGIQKGFDLYNQYYGTDFNVTFKERVI